MIKAVLHGGNGKKTLLIGLSQDNLDRLVTDMPIKVDALELVVEGGITMAEITEISIFAGPPGSTEEDLVEMLNKAGLKTPNVRGL
jgi:hypothetical protein